MTKATNLAISELLGSANLINEEIARYAKVTAEDMKRVANELFRNENSSTLYYLAKKK
jgi:predicted Zn-dependent peptidase